MESNIKDSFIEEKSEDEETRETILKVKNLSKLYGTDKKEAIKLKNQGLSKDKIYDKTKVTVALWDVNLEVKKKEIFVIIGLSGSGKSTLVRCFNMLNKPTTGRIYYNEKDVNKLNKKELNQ